MHSLADAARWVGSGRPVWVYQGDDAILDRLNSEGLKPSVWAHVHPSRANREWLETGRIRDLFTVSDTARISLLRSPSHAFVGRVYNPLSTVFEASDAGFTTCALQRYRRKRVVFSGHPSRTKGVHRLLRMWSHVREADSSAVLQLAGTGKLYGDSRPLGPHGISHPDFESQHVTPLITKFGSLEAAGVQPCGLLSPRELRKLYEQSSIGIVNLNWGEYTETFCCVAVEMLATGLPVFSVARGALPETIGSSNGAYLSRQESARREAGELVSLLQDDQLLEALGSSGAAYVRKEYSWTRILEGWEELLSAPAEIEALVTKWRGPRTLRYWVERSTGRLGVGWLLNWAQQAVVLRHAPSNFV